MTALLSGIVSAVVVLLAQHLLVWKRQRRIAMRQTVFDEAVRALAMYEVDAMDPSLQDKKPSATDKLAAKQELRLETKIAMQKALALVRAFFSKSTADAYSDVLSKGVSLDNIPNNEYYLALAQTMKLLASEIDADGAIAILLRNWFPPKQ